MRTPDRILTFAVFGLALGAAPALAFDGTTQPPAAMVAPVPAPAYGYYGGPYYGGYGYYGAPRAGVGVYPGGAAVRVGPMRFGWR